MMEENEDFRLSFPTEIISSVSYNRAVLVFFRESKNFGSSLLFVTNGFMGPCGHFVKAGTIGSK